MTLSPKEIDINKHIKPLKDMGLTDRAILDAVLVISYFNFVNRIVMGLGVESDPKEIEGYNY